MGDVAGLGIVGPEAFAKELGFVLRAETVGAGWAGEAREWREPLASKPGCCAESGLRWARLEAGSLVGRLSRRSGDEMVVVQAGERHSTGHRKTAADASSVLSRGF